MLYKCAFPPNSDDIRFTLATPLSFKLVYTCVYIYDSYINVLDLHCAMSNFPTAVDPVKDLMCVCVAVCCSVLQCVAVCCSVLQCVAVCCSVLQCVAM